MAKRNSNGPVLIKSKVRERLAPARQGPKLRPCAGLRRKRFHRALTWRATRRAEGGQQGRGR